MGREDYKSDLQSMARLTSKRSLNLWVAIGHKNVVNFTDSVATHSFISQQLVNGLGLQQAKETPFYWVKVSYGLWVVGIL